jgi:GLPGLI family protein
MKNILSLFTALCVLLAVESIAQSKTLFKVGIIEFERTQNIPAAFNYDPVMQRFVEKMGSEIYTSYFTLAVTPNETMYDYGKQNGFPNRFDEMPADKNQVYEHLQTKQKLIKKSVNGKTYTLSGDSLPIIQWKLTNELKDIAGINCRRANGIMFDSIYIVAFFSEKIPILSGPENFRGLPGMILGVSIPSEHIAWFATKITSSEVQIQQPKEENLIRFSEYNSLLLNKVARIPKFGSVMYKRALL